MNIFTQVFALFAVFIIGWAARLFGVLDRGSTKKLSVFLTSVCYPLLVISAFEEGRSFGSVGLMGTVLVIGLIVHLIPTVIVFFLYRGKRPSASAVLRFAAVFPSCGIAAIPLLKALYSSIGAFYGACFMLLSLVYMYTVGVFVLSFGKKKSFVSCLKELINPCVIGAAVGALLFLIKLQLPGFIALPVAYLGSMALPLSMVVLGSMMREVQLKNVFLGTDAYISAFIKLIALPLLVLLGCKIFGISRWTALTCVLLAALPTTMFTPLLAERYGADRETGIACAALSTVLSIVTVPLIMTVANSAFK